MCACVLSHVRADACMCLFALLKGLRRRQQLCWFRQALEAVVCTCEKPVYSVCVCVCARKDLVGNSCA